MSKARDLSAVVSSADTADYVKSANAFGARITNNSDSSQGLQVRTSDNDTGQYILDLQSSSSATGTDYASKMVVEKGGNVGIGVSPTTAYGNVLQVHDTGTAGASLRLTDSNSGSGTGNGSEVLQLNTAMYIMNRENGLMNFSTNDTERMRILNNGRIALHGIEYGTFPANNATVQIGIGGDVNMRFLGYGSSHTCVQFKHGGSTTVGSIVTAASSTTYNTSSDYRLKENIQNISDGITRVKQLSPKRFNFIVDADTTVDGFLAHEAATVVPEAVTGVKDGLEVWTEKDELPEGVSVGDNKLDDDGNTIPEYQGIDQSKLVPLLTAALQEAISKIETLETENTAIKARLDALEAG